MSSHAFALPTPGDEEQRRTTLRRYKFSVTGLLVVMAAIFLTCSWLQSRGDAGAWVGYVRAAAEAGMVGGLADWFAVTALFRRPMGLPIPHTALIPRKKDQVAGALSSFVSENFLNAQTITAKVTAADVPRRAGQWLREPDNAEFVSARVGSFIERAVTSIDPDEAQRLIQNQVIERASRPAWGPPLGRALDGLIADGKLEPLVDDMVAWGRRKVHEMEDSIVAMIDERMPRWAPRFAKELVGEKVYRELVSFMADVDEDPHHEARRAIRRQISQFAYDLQHDPEMISRVEGLKGDVLNSDALASISGGVWEQASASLVDAAADPDSALRRRIAGLCREWGDKLVTDPEVRASAARALERVTRFVAENGAGEIVGIISETIERWDGEEASEKIELMVGKDLQFIRINGTVVGALAGLAIYTCYQILFF
ncbi:DUF445 domain-containing protein [Corynebacterium timonense]|uniref:Uncharacterized membrane-anchored protein YjiN, DUF445 family n=1 Tax=Corynebacterium timonense TaxID=441500 RepID=A0A1H1TAF5_9CORY|nr:DUF445 family protein [Corynebacterium timonense]SDS57220.1 Uncharacterized membrane-anchored protein YjiN, DUF445 family [Corynebacterium timonense]